MDLALYARAEKLLNQAIQAQKKTKDFKPLPPAAKANVAEIKQFEKAMKSSGKGSSGSALESRSRHRKGMALTLYCC